MLSSSPSSTAAASPIVAREETPRELFSLDYAPASIASVGATTNRVGGISARGPASLAVDENDRIYIWDQARLRIVVYESGQYVRAIPVPYVERSATALLVDGGRLYLRATSYLPATIEYEIDATTGALLRATTDGSLYPRSRGAMQGPPPFTLGSDGSGLVYLLTFPDPGHQRYERHSAGGDLRGYATEPLPLKGVDAYVRADGALYELAEDFGGVGSVHVYALLSPVGGARPASRPVVAAPIAFGRAVPDRITVTIAGAGSADLDDAARSAFWWLASLATERAGLVDNGLSPLFLARWNDGSVLEIGAYQSSLGANEKTYVGPASAYEQFASYVLASPPRLANLAMGGAMVRIADLPGVERALTTAEIAALRDSVSRGFGVSEGELPGVLELPFPVYEIVLGDVVVRLRGADYGSVGEQLRTGAFAHDGRLADLARRWLPVPALGVSDVRSLFLADTVTIEQPGYLNLQDISRWKASIVRALSAGPGDPQSEPAGEPPATLVFRFPSGRAETVVVSRGSFTYRGRVIALPGVMSLVYYRGVP